MWFTVKSAFKLFNMKVSSPFSPVRMFATSQLFWKRKFTVTLCMQGPCCLLPVSCCLLFNIFFLIFLHFFLNLAIYFSFFFFPCLLTHCLLCYVYLMFSLECASSETTFACFHSRTLRQLLHFIFVFAVVSFVVIAARSCNCNCRVLCLCFYSLIFQRSMSTLHTGLATSRRSAPPVEWLTEWLSTAFFKPKPTAICLLVGLGVAVRVDICVHAFAHLKFKSLLRLVYICMYLIAAVVVFVFISLL